MNDYVLNPECVQYGELNPEKVIQSKKVVEIRENGGSCTKRSNRDNLLKKSHHGPYQPESNYLEISHTFTLKHDKIPMQSMPKIRYVLIKLVILKIQAKNWKTHSFQMNIMRILKNNRTKSKRKEYTYQKKKKISFPQKVSSTDPSI
jgi:hypothetical protein